MSTIRTGVFFLLICLAVSTAQADWKWWAEFTPDSSPELIALHEKLHEPRLQGVLGVPVENVTWTAEAFQIRLVSGTVFVEPPIEDASPGAFFVGEARVTFNPGNRKDQHDLILLFGRDSLVDLEVPYAYFWTLRGRPFLEQIGVEAKPSVPFSYDRIYNDSKEGLRNEGTRLLHSFLNREGRSKGTAHVLFAWEEIHPAKDRYAPLMYSFDPDLDHEVQLAASGDRTGSWEVMATVLRCLPEKKYFTPHAKVEIYNTVLTVDRGMYSAEENTLITFTPNRGLHALRVEFTSRMAVSKVTDAEGNPLPFLQWGYMKTHPNWDENILIDTGNLEPGASAGIRIVSSGSLFEPWYSLYWLAEEDIWHPLMDDPAGALYELIFRVPDKTLAIGAGRLESRDVEEDKKVYHYRSTRPFKRSTVYFGDFAVKTGEVDDTRIEVYVDRHNIGANKAQDLVMEEMTNILRYYNQLYPPLEAPVLRIAGIPTYHGRGFEGIILLGTGAGFTGDSGAFLFRAHEVAHQWWGNMLQPKNLPEDRWLSESLAEYSAMEYYRARFGNPEKVKMQMWENWIQYLVENPKDTYKNLLNEKAVFEVRETVPLINGTDNVYYKGPAVLHMLRYMFQAVQGSDEGFWKFLNDALTRFQYQQVSTNEFTALAEAHLGIDLDWFWDQWIYGGKIPEVKWSSTIAPRDDKWIVSVEAEQTDTEYNLAIPVYIHFKGDRQAVQPMFLKGAKGAKQILVPEMPVKITLNDYYEALVKLKH